MLTESRRYTERELVAHNLEVSFRDVKPVLLIAHHRLEDLPSEWIKSLASTALMCAAIFRFPASASTCKEPEKGRLLQLCRVQGVGCRVQGERCRMQDAGYRVQDVGCRV